MSISVIMPTYNRANRIKKAIDSVLAQQFSDLELLVIDDGSDDGTEEVVGQYDDQRVRHFKLNKNCGVSVARNVGLNIAQCEDVTFVDSDDCLYGDFLGEMYSQKHTYHADVLMSWYRKGIEKSEAAVVGAGDRFFIRSTSALYSREFLLENQLLFPSGIQCGEDICFILTVMAVAGCVVDLRQAGRYQYIQHHGARLSREADKFKQLLKSFMLLNNQLRLRNFEYRRLFMKKLFHLYTDDFKKVFASEKEQKRIAHIYESCIND